MSLFFILDQMSFSEKFSEACGDKDPKEITKLELTNKEITELEDLSQCEKLQNLNISKNQLTTLNGIENCQQLTQLNVSENNIEEISTNLENLQKLRVFKANHNQLSSIGSLEKCVWIQSIFLSENKFTEIPDFSIFTNLNTLILSKNQIVDIQILSKCHKLESINLANNQIKVIPDFSELKELTNLYINGNEIEEIPETLVQAEKLRLLDISHNKFATEESIAPLFQMGGHLKTLNIIGNPIIEEKGNEIKEKCQNELQGLVTYNSERLKPKKSHYPQDHPKYQEKRREAEKALKAKFGPDVLEVKKLLKEEKKKEKKAKEDGKEIKVKTAADIKKEIIRKSAAEKFRKEKIQEAHLKHEEEEEQGEDGEKHQHNQKKKGNDHHKPQKNMKKDHKKKSDKPRKNPDDPFFLMN